MSLNNRDKVILRVFRLNHVKGATEVPFTMEEIRQCIGEVGYVERNVADLRYQYASGRAPLPKAINDLGPWMIQGRGKGKYAFIKLLGSPRVDLPDDLMIIPVPDSTPEIVLAYAGSDEQGLLAKVLYNRLVDCFLGLTCYHIQNHWRTTIPGEGQCEIDDLYVGLDKRGRQYVIPIEAKGHKDALSKTQIAQAISFARKRYPLLILRPLGIHERRDGSIYMVEFEPGEHPDEISIVEMRRYKLVSMDQIPLRRLQAQSD